MMRRTGASIDDKHELIEVARETERSLRPYALGNPEGASGIERVLNFRRRVAEEFERQLRLLAPALE
jgi:hypothetical protein